MASAEQKDPFDALMAFIIEAGKLEKTDAAIYILGLKKGVITSGDIVDASIISRQTTAGDRLRKLSNAGYFEAVLKELNRRGQGRARKFKASPPQVVLRELLEMYQGVNQVLETVNEHREVLSEADPPDDEIWLIKPQKTAMHQVATVIGNAQTSVKIYSHDCSWFRVAAITNALVKARGNKIKISVIATNPNEQIEKWLKKIGGDLQNTKLPCVPFCVVDDATLFLPCAGGVLGNDYFVIKTKQRYLVDDFVEMFETMKKIPCGDED
jgi:sugar-specific transcriptional regulator TrmB